MKTMIQLDDRLYQIKVPLPFPLLWVNSYVVKGKRGWTVIDPGLHTLQAEQRWEEAAAAIGFGWRSIAAVVLTHHHPDHYGMAGWFQERTGAPVYASAAAEEQARKLWGEEAGETAQNTLGLFVRHGLPEHEIQPMKEHLFGFIEWVSPQPKQMEHLAPGSPVSIGDEDYEAILTEGHASGHLSFLNRRTGRIFCGDHVLPGITPNVSYLPFGDRNPLRTYLADLERAGKLPVTQALPGHRDPFQHFSQRCAAICQHHTERLQRMEEWLAEHPEGNAYQLCKALFGDRLSMHQLRFALSETIAHLIYLESM